MFGPVNRGEQIRHEIRSLQSDVSIAKFRLLQSLTKDLEPGSDWDFGMAPGGETDFCDVQACAETMKASGLLIEKLEKELRSL